MNTETISFEVSQDILAALKVDSSELAQRMRLLAAYAKRRRSHRLFSREKTFSWQSSGISGDKPSGFYGCFIAKGSCYF